METTDLPEGAYTVWWIVWNDPSVCVDGCDGSDLRPGGVPNPGAFVGRATGKVVGPTGKGNFGASLKVGDTSEVLFGPGLTDSRVAEVHMVVRYHGPVVPSQMPAQINSVGGGCTFAAAPGLFQCYDPQAVAFPTP